MAQMGAGGMTPENRRKMLVQMLAQRASQGAASPAGSVAFGGIRATPKARDSQGVAVTKPAQIAAQFIGGLGIGARAGANQAGSAGGPISRFLPTGGGPVERRVADPGATRNPNGQQQSASAPDQSQAVTPEQAAAAEALGVSAQPNMTLDQLNAQLAAQGRAPLSYPDSIHPDQPGMISSDMTGGVSGLTPVSGSANLIPLGNGAYYDPATGLTRFPGQRVAML